MYSPVFDEFWARRAQDTEENDEPRGFWRCESAISREESKTYPCSFFMRNDRVTLLIPNILDSSIKYIYFMEMVRSVLEANPERSIERSDMMSLWDAIIYNIYHFESSRTQREKAREVCGFRHLKIW